MPLSDALDASDSSSVTDIEPRGRLTRDGLPGRGTDLEVNSDMADRNEPEAADALAGAEAEAAREAAREAAADAAQVADAAPRVVTPRARTSGKRPAGASTGRKRSPAEGAPGKDSAGDTGTAGDRPRLPAEPPRSVSGETITIRQGGVDSVTATNIDLRQGGIGRARATDIAVSQGGVGAARADRVSIELGAMGAALTGDLTISQGVAGTVVAREARVEQALVRTMIANVVHVERPTGVLFLIARRVDGNVRAVLDWRGALAFGAAFSVVASLLGRGRRRQ